MNKLSDAKKKAEENPNDPDIQTEYAEELIQDSQFETAAAVAEKALKLDNKHVKALSVVALYHIVQNNLDEAKRILDEAMEIDNQSDSVWNRKGLVHMFSKEYMDAILSYHKVIELKPEFKGLSNLGWCYYYAGDYQNALKYGELQVELEPENMFGLKLVLQTHLTTGNIKKSVDVLLNIVLLGKIRMDILDLVTYYFRRIKFTQDEFDYLFDQLKKVDVNVGYRNNLFEFFSIILDHLNEFSYSTILLNAIENPKDPIRLELDMLRLEWLKDRDFDKTHPKIRNMISKINSELTADRITDELYFEYAQEILSLYGQIQSKEAANFGSEFFEQVNKNLADNIDKNILYMLVGDLYSSINEFKIARNWYEKVPDNSPVYRNTIGKSREMTHLIESAENYIKKQLYFVSPNFSMINETMTPELLSIQKDQKLSTELFRYPVDNKEKFMEFLEFCLLKMTYYFDNVIRDGSYDGEERWSMRHDTYKSMANVLRYFHDDAVERLLEIYFDPPSTIKAWKIVEIIIYLVNRDHATYFHDSFDKALKNSKEQDYFRILAKHGNERSLELVFDFLKSKLDKSKINEKNKQVQAMEALVELSSHYDRVNEPKFLNLIERLLNNYSCGEATRIKAIEYIRNNNLQNFTEKLIDLTNEDPPEKDKITIWAIASMNHGYVGTISLAARETLASFGIIEYINPFFELMIQERAPSSLFNSINNICKNNDGFTRFKTKFIKKVQEIKDQKLRKYLMKYVSDHLIWSKWGYEQAHGRNHFELYIEILCVLRPYTTFNDTGFIAFGIHSTRGSLKNYPYLLWKYDDYLLSYLGSLMNLEFDIEKTYNNRLKPIKEKLVL